MPTAHASRTTALAGLVVLGIASLVMANVYPSGVTISAASFDSGDQTTTITYVLNENADGDGVNPGVRIEVLNSGNTAVRTVNIARQKRGTWSFQWDGRNDAGAPVPVDTYTVRITASDYGYTSWTQISPQQTSTSFEYPFGVAVNSNPSSPHYGKVYVSNARVGTTVFGRACNDAIYVLAADATDLGNFTGGVTWTGNSAPYRSMVGEDDHLYVADLSNDLAFDFNPDTMIATQLIDASNRTTSQWVHSIWVTGTQAGGNRKVYLVNGNYYDNNRKGLIGYNLGGNATATPGDTGFQVIGPAYFTFYPYDIARDAAGNWYTNNYRASAGQASPLARFIDDPLNYPLNTPAWEVSNAYTYSWSVGYFEPRKWAAFCSSSNGFVRLFDRDSGTLLHEFDAGTGVRDVAFDAAGNLYTVDNIAEWLRVWSPPDGPNSKDISRSVSVAGQGTGGPVITAHPSDLAICPTEGAAFSVTATGGTLTYQWKKNGSDLTDGGDVSGATTAALTLTNVPATDDGAVFTCVVTDENGVAVSNPAVLTVGLVWEQFPLSTRVCPGASPQFNASVTLPGVTYQWQRTFPPATDFVDIAGETGTSLTLTNVQMTTENGAQIRCVATGPGACGTSNSPVATLTVSSGPVTGTPMYGYITGDPPYLPGGSSIVEIAVVSSTGAPTFQWRANGADLVDGVYPWGTVSGANSPSMLITELKCGYTTSISVVVSDDCGPAAEKFVGARYQPGYPVTPITVGRVENCGNGIDDDCDLLVDCDDTGNCGSDPLCEVFPTCNEPYADWDLDGDVDMDDFAVLQGCLWVEGEGRPARGFDPACDCFDRNRDGWINVDDIARFEACGSGPGVLADTACDDLPDGVGKVVINEFAYDMVNTAGTEIPDELEFVEIYNRSGQTIDISGWLLRASDVAPPGDDNRDFLVPGTRGSGTTLLAPGGYYVFTSPNVPVPAKNPPALDWQTINPSTDIWENGPDVLQLLDANRTVVDTVVYDRRSGSVWTSPEGSIWGELQTVAGAAQQSVSRWIDGLDTDNNGRDFGMRAWTPGTSNLGAGSLVGAYVLPDLDALTVGSYVAGLDPSFWGAVVINPTDNTTVVEGSVVNPNAIPASPQGGNAAVCWDFKTGGGNAVVSRNIMSGDGKFDLYAYIDPSFADWGTNTGAESTTYGIMGTVDPVHAIADPDGALYGDVATSSGITGLAWICNKVKSGTTSYCRLYLVDAGPGGDSSNGVNTPSNWVVLTTIDMTALGAGWYRLSIDYDADTGAVTAVGPSGTVNFATATGLTGGFYVGYRETVTGIPAFLRPATFDSVP